MTFAIQDTREEDSFFHTRCLLEEEVQNVSNLKNQNITCSGLKKLMAEGTVDFSLTKNNYNFRNMDPFDLFTPIVPLYATTESFLAELDV